MGWDLCALSHVASLGTHFRYILNYLRDGTFNFPGSISARASWRLFLANTRTGDELLAEARFFQLRELIAYLEGKGNHYAAHQVRACVHSLGQQLTFAIQLSGKAIDVLRSRKGHDIASLKEYLLSEFEKQVRRASGVARSLPLTHALSRPVAARLHRWWLFILRKTVRASEKERDVRSDARSAAKLYRDASDPDIRNIVISDLQVRVARVGWRAVAHLAGRRQNLGFKVVCQTTLSSAYAVHVFETSLHASSLVVKHEVRIARARRGPLTQPRCS